MRILLIIALFFVGCAAKTGGETVSVAEVSGNKRLKEVAREFLTDIGGEEVLSVNGFYFNAKSFSKKEHIAYKKWRKKFAQPKNCTLSELFQINYEGENLLKLFSLPRTSKLKTDSIAALCLPPFALPFEFDPRWILTYLAKGIHILAINYEGGDEETNCKSAKLAIDWLKTHTDGKLLILGKGLGSIPASYVAAITPYSNLILENALTLHPHTHKEWLRQVQGKILMIESIGAPSPFYLPKSALLMQVTGSHFGTYWGELKPTWYENEKDQWKLLKFLKE